STFLKTKRPMSDDAIGPYNYHTGLMDYFYIRHWLICFPIISDISMELFTLHILLMMFIVY
ncbi:hypothetical protein, partial [Bacteroides cellulosilyticus]|uniref:hypothetical protein n=1 Tax=Bacteroides cellulosilyticus TaxID=246787 RepID=UPI0032EF1804